MNAHPEGSNKKRRAKEIAALEGALKSTGKEEVVRTIPSGVVIPEDAVKEHVIDCDVPPYTPDGWRVKDHQKGGQLKFDASQIELYSSAAQKNRKGSGDGSKLQEEPAGKSVLNANVLDYVLTHTELIPEDWKGKSIFFWGTTYRDSGGNPCVRCLSWNGAKWFWSSRWIASSWSDSSLAALKAG